MYYFTEPQLRKALAGAIQMYREYRDQHDRADDAATVLAVSEVVEGLEAERELLQHGDLSALSLQLPEPSSS